MENLHIYYLNLNEDDSGSYIDHEVHRDDCHLLPKNTNKLKQIGMFDSCEPAVAQAKLIMPNADGCGICCPGCHTS
ncbi:hypothetical protein PVT67_08920 [Gallaecimonas kandeliae]|uniref:hypothetical protein n=1 Tax=Gallaecimonas kandeliae TaxID=3029055 RepID=UPI002649828B|nr:hypothetical protein [Gallaecimonas kandeliae]WKE67335.1 hypothetical protein PVT67_08920 [Gallaecimonas kandeliae]